MDNLDEIIAGKSSVEIGEIQDQKEKKLNLMEANHNVVEEEKLTIQREIINLQLKKKDLEIVLNKSGGTIKELKSDIKRLNRAFWTAKNQGL